MRTKKLVISLLSMLCFASTAYADGAYQAVVKEGEVLLSLNDEEQKYYKQGDNISLAADDLICLHSGAGVVTVSGEGLNEEFSKPFQCQATPIKESKKGWFANAKEVVNEVGSEGMPANLASKKVTTSLILLGGESYFVLENSSWHKNSRTLPLTLQLIDSGGEVVKEYVSHHKKTTMFFVPKKEIEDKNGQSYALKVINKSGSELSEPTRFSLNTLEIEGGSETDSNSNKALQFQLEHQLVKLKEKTTKLGVEHSEVADVYTDMGLINSQHDNHIAAAVHLNNALKIRRKVFGEESFVVAQTYHDLGIAYEKMGIIPKAVENKNKALKIWEGKSRGGIRGTTSQPEKVYYEKENHTIVDVLYGTDRGLNKAYKVGDSREDYFTGERSTLQYGLAQVSIPKTHKLGGMERPGWPSFTKETIGEHVLIKDLKSLDSKQFVDLMGKKLGNVKDNDILIFIHGYNVSFASAVRRTAQLSFDLEFNGVPLTYSWPSKSETDEYLTDESSIQYTVPHLVRFLKEVIEKNNKSKNAADIHILGHSMGTRALSYAVKELSFVYVGKPLFKNIIFAAPDIDQDVFEVSIFPYVKKTAEKITLYASSEDVALQLSASMHGGQRVGQGGDSVFIFEGLDTVDASGIDTNYFSLSHSYFSEKALMVGDIKEVIFKSLPPSERKSLVEKAKQKMAYWMFKFK